MLQTLLVSEIQRAALRNYANADAAGHPERLATKRGTRCTNCEPRLTSLTLGDLPETSADRLHQSVLLAQAMLSKVYGTVLSLEHSPRSILSTLQGVCAALLAADHMQDSDHYNPSTPHGRVVSDGDLESTS
mmetsp:Transcript_114407/g.334476  ORF Transcript_114407/g.334476 Transcript_114407/m.334476 type:complete len:132 (-) Transcript_114407:507-902(-)